MTSQPKVSEYQLSSSKDIENGDSKKIDIMGKEKISPDLTWVNLNFKVKDKNILTNCWGKVASGKICAIMGPSGAGKSSLLNVLAGRSTSTLTNTIEGTVRVSGKEINPADFRKNIAYVMQDDALLATATPREALTFSASMRLPSTTSNEEIHSLVEKLLDHLGLQDCADVMIGGALIKGISGGQRKRTSVGVELITSPQLLFLDEPTTGLDSHTAFSLVSLLKKVALEDCTILCTIHQPSSEVFFLFDSVIFMKDGRIFYQGPVTGIKKHFLSFGYECPHNYNPSDYIMNLSQIESNETIESKNMFMKPPPELTEPTQSHRLDSHFSLTAETSFFRQLFALTYRESLGTYRDVNALIARFGVTIVLNLIFGLIFLNAGGRGNDTNEDFNSHFGAVTMVMISGMFGSAQPIMLSFPFERPMFLREYSTGTYGIVPYFMSKLIVEIPLNFVQVLFQYLLVYFMVDMQGSFIYIVLATFGLAMSSCSVAVMLGCIFADVKDASEMSPLLFVPQMLFIGFFINTSQIPIFLRWAQYLCSLKYAMNLVLMTEFDLNNHSCQTSSAAEQNCKNILTDNNIETNKIYVYVIALFLLFAGFRIAGMIILREKAKVFY